MRTLKEVELELAQAKEELSTVEGSTAEVYSRIVGYYRSVRNWNKGKREEYGERRLFDVKASLQPKTGTAIGASACSTTESATLQSKADIDNHVLLFVRNTCPACPGAKDAAGKLGIPVDMVNADTEEGLAYAVRLGVMSTPTAILYSGTKELQRARDSASIASLSRLVREKVAS
ncbi:MAG: hypothetical protein Ta2B_11140 [Termitinemataceae bacterium]|nr:MAG: hypothetical protein Ta2B_11140 [Termitinemataceae bacterium]